MASQPSLSDHTKEFRAQAADLCVSDRLGSLLVKSFDLLAHLQNDALGAAELDFGLQSLESEFDLVRRHDQIPRSPLRSIVYGLVQSMHGTVTKMKNEDRIALRECVQLGFEDDSTSSEMGETRSRSEESILDPFPVENTMPDEEKDETDVQQCAAAATVAAPSINVLSAAIPAATTKARGGRKVLPSSSSSPAAAAASAAVGSRPRRSRVKPVGYWARERSRSPSPGVDDLPTTKAAATAAAATRPALMHALNATSEIPMKREWEVKEEPLSEGEGTEVDMITHAGRGVKRRAEESCFSDIEDEDGEEEKMATSSNSLHPLLSTPPTSSGLPEGSFTTIEDESGKRSFRCEICKRSHSHFHNLKSHIRSHMGDRRFGCSTCGTRFFRQAHLDRHKRGTCDTRPHLCAICGKRFTEEETLRDHMILHEHQQRQAKENEDGSMKEEEEGREGGKKMRFEKNEKGEYKCTHCTTTFKYICHIERHVRSHTGDRPFSCDSCSRSFAQLSAFVQHKRIHSGELPYPCSYCDRRFRVLGSLNAHLRKTHGELLYVCQTCGQKFERPADLKEHRVTHTEAK